MNIFPAMTFSAYSRRSCMIYATSGCRRKAWHGRRKDPNAQRYYDALQATFKILINSFYGYLGFSMGHFNDFAQADRVTRTGTGDHPTHRC